MHRKSERARIHPTLSISGALPGRFLPICGANEAHHHVRVKNVNDS